MNTEIREDWYKKADAWEVEFVSKFGDRLGVIINPSKEFTKHAPDLFIIKSSVSADLKVQNEPFYKSLELYGINPAHCWTFNVSDLVEYIIKYSDDFGIFIWVRYQNCSGYGVKVRDTEEVYYTTIGSIKRMVRKSNSIHKYVRRINDTNGNSYGSHTFDLSDTKNFTRIYHHEGS